MISAATSVLVMLPTTNGVSADAGLAGSISATPPADDQRLPSGKTITAARPGMRRLLRSASSAASSRASAAASGVPGGIDPVGVGNGVGVGGADGVGAGGLGEAADSVGEAAGEGVVSPAVGGATAGLGEGFIGSSVDGPGVTGGAAVQAASSSARSGRRRGRDRVMTSRSGWGGEPGGRKRHGPLLGR